MELGRFQDAEDLLAELTGQKPDDLTLKLATASLYKKMGKPKSEVFPIYDEILDIAIKKGDAEATKKHVKTWLENLDESVYGEDPEEVIQRAAEISPFIVDSATSQTMLKLLQKMGDEGHINNRQVYAILKPLIKKKTVSLEEMGEFQQRLLTESETEMGGITRKREFFEIFARFSRPTFAQDLVVPTEVRTVRADRV
jgi:hypothetical protein